MLLWHCCHMGSRETTQAKIVDPFKESNTTFKISIQRSPSVVHEQTNGRMAIYMYEKQEVGTN